MKVVFFLPAGMIEWKVPADAQATFSFATLISRIRSDGFFMAPDLYLRHEALCGLTFVPEGMASPQLVAGMTKQ